jgi:hypothetical protein
VLAPFPWFSFERTLTRLVVAAANAGPASATATISEMDRSAMV